MVVVIYPDSLQTNSAHKVKYAILLSFVYFMRVDLLRLKGGMEWQIRCVTQPFAAGGLGGAVSPPRGPGRSPGRKRILATIYSNLALNQVSGSPSTPLIPAQKNVLKSKTVK